MKRHEHYTPQEFALEAALEGLTEAYRDGMDEIPKRYLAAIQKEGERVAKRFEKKGGAVGALIWDR